MAVGQASILLTSSELIDDPIKYISFILQISQYWDTPQKQFSFKTFQCLEYKAMCCSFTQTLLHTWELLSTGHYRQ